MAVSLIALESSSFIDFSHGILDNPKVIATHNFTQGHNPSISVNPNTGDLYAVYYQTQNNSTNLYLTKSTDNGTTYSNPIRVNDKLGGAADTFNSIPIEFGENNEVYVAWMDSEEDPDYPWGYNTLRFSKSMDGGKTFSPAVNPVIGLKSINVFFDLVRTGNDTLYLSFLSALPNESGTPIIGYPASYAMVKSLDGGKTFGSPITLDKQSCVCCQTSSTVGPDGEIYFAWRDLQHESDLIPVNPENPYNYGFANGSLFEDFNYDDYEAIRDIKVMHTIDNAQGIKFSPVYAVSEDNWYINGCPDAGPGMAFDSNGVLHVAWFTGSKTADNGLGYYYAYSVDKGATFSKPIPLLTDKEFVPPTEVSLDIDKNDNVWITFIDQQSTDILRYSKIDFGFPSKMHLSVIDENHQIVFNGPIIEGGIGEMTDIAVGKDKAFIAYRDGDDAKISTLTM